MRPDIGLVFAADHYFSSWNSAAHSHIEYRFTSVCLLLYVYMTGIAPVTVTVVIMMISLHCISVCLLSAVLHQSVKERSSAA